MICRLLALVCLAVAILWLPIGFDDVRVAVRRIAYSVFLVAIGVFMVALSARAATRVPDVSAHLRLLVQQAVGAEWGIDGSPALLAAQLHQESDWDAHAQSSVGAEGLAQMMPATGKWLAAQFPQVGEYDPWSPAWSIVAAAVYDHWLYARNPAADACSHWAFALSAYNGGETLLHREQSLAQRAGRDDALWFDNTALYRARSLSAWQQNRGYVSRILLVLEPAYVDAGWSGEVLCP